MTGGELLKLRKAIRSGEKLSDEDVKKLSSLRREENKSRVFMNVSKVALQEGEEMMDFVWMMYDAVQTNRIILADGSLDAWLNGIYDDYVIVQDGNTGKMFKADFSRNAEGEIEFSNVVEVRMQWVPVNASESEVARSVSKRATQSAEIFELKKRNESKWNFLPDRLQG
jgi:hypothetical protein